MTTDNILVLKFDGRRFGSDDATQVRRQLAQGADDVTVQAYAAVEHDETYVYCRPTSAASADTLARVRAIATRSYPEARQRLLENVSDLPGASHGQPAPWHYIVETDVLEAAEQDLNDWYDQEHLPGLASVPGTVRAQRYACREASPRYHACYDLATLETFGSPPWLAVRASAWSDRVRPSFRNTKRTMFRAVI
jgi:hypothetical protein